MFRTSSRCAAWLSSCETFCSSELALSEWLAGVVLPLQAATAAAKPVAQIAARMIEINMYCAPLLIASTEYDLERTECLGFSRGDGVLGAKRVARHDFHRARERAREDDLASLEVRPGRIERSREPCDGRSRMTHYQ